MKTVLLLGGFGFIGTNIMKYAEENHLAYDFIVFDRTTHHPAGVEFSCINTTYAGDFSDENLIEKIFITHKIDIVIHAISSTVPVSSISARYDITSNLLPTLQLLDQMIKHNVSNIVFLSSGGAIYGESINGDPHKETDDVFPKSSYGVVKLAIEKYLFMYKEIFGLRPLILRLSNPYGPYHYSEKQGIVNIALRAAQQGKQFIVWGDGSATKDYIHIEDVCKIIWSLIENNHFCDVLNIASGELMSVNTILETIQNKYSGFKWEYRDKNSNDIQRIDLSIEKLGQHIKINYKKLSEYINIQ